jgi:hypothetical protein
MQMPAVCVHYSAQRRRQGLHARLVQEHPCGREAATASGLHAVIASSQSIPFCGSFIRRFGRAPLRAVLNVIPIAWAARSGALTQADFFNNAMGIAMTTSIKERRPPFKEGDRQRGSTELNEPQPERDFGGVAEVREPVFIDLALVRMCKDELDAINLCGIDKGHWSRIRKGMAHFPTKQRLNLMRLAGNWVPLQYELDRSRVLDRIKEHILRDRSQRDGLADFIGRAA